MNILHIIHQYLPDHVGGTELYTQQVARVQAENGHSVAIAHPISAEGNEPIVDQDGDVTIYRLPIGNESRQAGFMNSFGQPVLEAQFAKLLPQFDIVHIQHLMGVPLAIIEQIQSLGIPYFVTLHDYWFMCSNAQLYTNYDHTICAGPDAQFYNCGRCSLSQARLPDNPIAAYAFAPMLQSRGEMLRPILESATAVIAPTEFVRNIFQENGLAFDNLQVIRHGIDLPTHLPTANHNDDELHVVYVGSIMHQKGVHVLIEAFNQLPHAGFRLTVAGSLDAFPSYAKQLQEQVTHSGVSFLGRIDRPALWNLLATAHLLALPSLWYETSSLVLDEAFAMQVPVIASNIGVMSAKIEQEKTGFLFPVGDSDQLAAQLVELAANPQSVKRARKAFPQIPSVNQHVDQITTIYHLAQEQINS